jgi:hypothetical protein
MLICAAKHKPSRAEIGDDALYAQAMKVPYGMALCIVEVFDCVPTESISLSLTPQERELGDYTPGRFAWLTRGLRSFTRPFPVTGHQGLFKVPDAEIERNTLLPVKKMTLRDLLLGL